MKCGERVKRIFSSGIEVARSHDKKERTSKMTIQQLLEFIQSKLEDNCLEKDDIVYMHSMDGGIVPAEPDKDYFKSLVFTSVE